MQVFTHVLLSFYVPPNSPCISFFSFSLNCFSPAITCHPLAPLFAFPFILFLGPRCSGGKLEQQDAENALRQISHINCAVKQRQKQYLTVERKWDRRSAAGAGIQTEKGDRCSHMFALIQKFRRNKRKPSIFELKCPEHLK